MFKRTVAMDVDIIVTEEVPPPKSDVITVTDEPTLPVVGTVERTVHTAATTGDAPGIGVIAVATHSGPMLTRATRLAVATGSVSGMTTPRFTLSSTAAPFVPSGSVSGVTTLPT